MVTYYKESEQTSISEKMEETNLNLNINFDILDFENYVYSESEILPTKLENVETKYLFPNHTSLDNQLIVLSEQN